MNWNKTVKKMIIGLSKFQLHIKLTVSMLRAGIKVAEQIGQKTFVKQGNKNRKIAKTWQKLNFLKKMKQ